jgi:hypothetical protein
MINQAIELHDSELAVLWHEQNGEAVLIFSKLRIHQSDGRPGIDPGVGWFQRAELVIEHASLTEDLRGWPWQIFHGEILIGGIKHENVAPLPLARKGDFKLALNAIDDDSQSRQIEIIGTAATLALLGVPRKHEDFSGVGWR